MEANKLKLLAIDDNRDNLTSLKAVITDKLPGAALLTAMNGAQGLELARAEDPDVILLDIVMPGMDGYAVCRKLKQDERLQSIPVIFLTALKTDQESRIRALDAGAEGFLSKPFDEVELIAQVRAMAKIKAANQNKRLEKEQLEALVAERTRGVKQELAERKRVEKTLKESEERYVSLLYNLEAGIVVHAPDTSVLMSNTRASKLLGISIDQMKGKAASDPAWKFVSEANTPLPLDEYPVNRIVSGRQPIKNHVLGIRQPGKNDIVWVTVNGFPVLDNSGEITEIVISFIDITDRKQAEDALQTKNDELIRFNYAVSHDLKTPLVTIKTFLGYLEQDMAKADHKHVAQDLDFIHKAANKMNALLEELLVLSRIGHVVNLPVEAPLQEIVREALSFVAGRIAERNVRVTVGQEPIILYGDRLRMVEVFQNLLDNAAKFMGDQSEPLITIGAEKKNGEMMCFVRDNGMGIDPRFKDKLFGLFEKLNDGIEGSGIGLALAKRIVETHGGRIWAESEGIGKGACLWFSLPGKQVQG